MYYSSFGALAFLVHIIINFDALKKPKDRRPGTPALRYHIFLWSVLIYYVSDILWGILYENRLVPLAYADTVVYFTSMVLSVLLWSRYVVSYLNQKSFFSTILTVSGWVIFYYELVVLLINFYYPVVFWYDADKVYRPGQARYITLAIQVILFLMTSVYTLVISAKSEGEAKRHHRTIGFSGIIMTVFILLQALDPFLPFYAVGCLLTTCLIHSFITEDEKKDHRRELGSAMHKAYTDPLTGIRNVHAYRESQARYDQRIEEGTLDEFGVIVFDLNGLKTINDTQGHEAGDQYIKAACVMICQQFKHSPVFRIGGDEFVALLEGEDYRNRQVLLDSFNRQVERNRVEGRVVISSGLGVFRPESDKDYNAVFERADHQMYERKKALKAVR